MTPPALLRPRFDAIPEALKALDQWLVWQGVWQPEKGKYSKIPYNARSGTKASSTDPATWSSFEEARCTCEKQPNRYHGVGFVLQAGDPFAGVDLDHAIGDDKQLSPEAARLVGLLDSYTEVSPSGTGLRIFVVGKLPEGGRKKGDVEMYEEGRYLTLTGRTWPTAPDTIEPRQEALTAIHAEVFPPPAPRAPSASRTNPADLPADDNDLLKIAFGAKNGAKIETLYRGDTSGYPGASEADLALCTLLAFYAGDDPQRLDRLFRGSGLMRDKWDEVHYAGGITYGEKTVEKGLAACTEFYSPTGVRSNDFARRVQKQTGKDPGWKDEAQEDANRTIPDVEERPLIIVTGRQQREISDDAFTALESINEIAPTLFSRNRGIVVLSQDKKGIAYTQSLTTDALDHRLRRAADWVSVRQDKEKGAVFSSAPVPRWLAADLLNSPEIEDRVPSLKSIAGSPVVTASGRILGQHGYDAESGIFIACSDVTLPKNVTMQDARDAAARLFGTEEKISEDSFIWQGGLFNDFPFASRSDRANAAALMLTPILRPYIHGSVPMGVIEAPSPGTGKTLLASCFFRITSPGFVITDTPSERERGAAEEWSKLIPAVLSGSPAVVLFDNLRGPVSSSSLEATLTVQDTITFRRMGKSDETLSRDVSGVTFAATGNNAVFSRDMSRRCYFIRLDAGVEHPESRKGFRISDIDDHISRNRDALLQDVLTIVSGWIAAGRPTGKARKGSFDQWAAALSGVLNVAGIEGFLSNDKERAEASDPETVAWKSFTAAWWHDFSTYPMTAKELVPLAAEHEIISDGMGGSRALGKRLSAVRDRIFGDLRIISMSGHASTNKFSLRQLPPETQKTEGLEGLEGLDTEVSHARKEDTSHNTHMESSATKPSKPSKPSNGIETDLSGLTDPFAE